LTIAPVEHLGFAHEYDVRFPFSAACGFADANALIGGEKYKNFDNPTTSDSRSFKRQQAGWTCYP
jgi:hypothetical protein